MREMLAEHLSTHGYEVARAERGIFYEASRCNVRFRKPRTTAVGLLMADADQRLLSTYSPDAQSSRSTPQPSPSRRFAR